LCCEARRKPIILAAICIADVFAAVSSKRVEKRSYRFLSTTEKKVEDSSCGKQNYENGQA
jgi:hypothetical protein